MPTLCGFDRVNVADDVRDGHVGRGEFFDEARVALDPLDVRHVAVKLKRLPTISGDWMKWIVVDFRARDDGDTFIQEVRQLTYDAALGLAAQSQENPLVA